MFVALSRNRSPVVILARADNARFRDTGDNHPCLAVHNHYSECPRYANLRPPMTNVVTCGPATFSSPVNMLYNRTLSGTFCRISVEMSGEDAFQSLLLNLILGYGGDSQDTRVWYVSLGHQVTLG